MALVEPNTTKPVSSEGKAGASASHGSEATCDRIHAEPRSLSNAMLCWAFCSRSEAEYGSEYRWDCASHPATQRAGCGRQPYCFTHSTPLLTWYLGPFPEPTRNRATAQKMLVKAPISPINLRTEAHTARICQSTIDGKGAAAPPSFSISPVLGWLFVSTSTGWNTECS